ncbi:protein prune homolog 2 isoform X2 [Homalodisca vitripennis]|uniref:CRAL-TRIO domain-containing protein n=4 Tax=Proconiini TaxID=565685 RepID=A0A1B6IQ15_9HEMI|nr:protein prune homolog 2 isoform X2 [Homalodisca vitripennis]
MNTSSDLSKHESSPECDRMDISETSEMSTPSEHGHVLLDNQISLAQENTPVPAKRLSLTASKVQNGITRVCQPVDSHPLDNLDNALVKDISVSLESLNLDLPTLENYIDEPIDFPSSPKALRQTLEASGISLPQELDSGATGFSDEEEEDHSIFQAVLSPDCQDVRLKREPPSRLSVKKRRIPLPKEILNGLDDDQISSVISDEDIDELLSPGMDSPDELEDSILEQLDNSPTVEPIPELTAEEERVESRNWQRCNVAGVERRIDMKVIEPYKCVLSHGGYLNAGSHNAIIVFSACFLPHHGRVDYSYVMDNLFLYVLSTLDQLITEDYVLVYLHGGTAKDCMPTFSWLKRCYQMIDRRLRKNLKRLYLVHPTFWLKTIVLMTKPFISTKFSKKLHFINSLAELLELLPLEQASIPDRVKKYDQIKQSLVEPVAQ